MRRGGLDGGGSGEVGWARGMKDGGDMGDAGGRLGLGGLGGEVGWRERRVVMTMAIPSIL